MKDRGPYETILLISSWTGNLILTLLAFFLAFGSAQPLTPLLFLTVAACILFGNALPISVYLIQLWWRQAEIRGEAQEASVTVRDALLKAVDTEERLRDLHDATAKAILVGRQIPEKIHERTEQITGLLGTLEGRDLEDLLSQLKGTVSVTESVRKRLAEMEEGFGEELRRLRKEVARLNEQVALQAEAEPVARLEGVIREKLADLESKLSDNKQSSAHSGIPAAAGLSGQRPAEKAGPEPARREADPNTVVEEQAAETAAHAEKGLAEPEGEPEQAATPSQEAARKRVRKEAAPKKAKEPDPQAELGISLEPEPPRKAPNRTIVSVHAMVGIANRITIRGDGPYLSWDKGTPMELVGIGEYRWECEGLEEPIGIKFLLNDRDWAEGENIDLQPGEVLRVQPVFAGKPSAR